MSVSKEYFITDVAKVMETSPIGCPDLRLQENQSSIIVHTNTKDEVLKGKRVYLYFSGGNGRSALSSVHQDLILEKGIIPISAMAYPKIPSKRNRKNWSPVHNYSKDSDEIEGTLDKVIELFGVGTEVVIAGHSRGAGALGIWLSTERCRKYMTLLTIKKIFINSPYGGSKTRRFYDGYHANRALISLVNNTLDISPTKVAYVFGKGDYTHTTRFVVENLRTFLTNNHVEILLLGDDKVGHAGMFASIDNLLPMIQQAFDMPQVE